MKAFGIAIALAGALTLSTGAALGQVRVGGHGAAGAPSNGSYGNLPKGTAESGHVDIGTERRGPHIGAGGSSRFSAGIGSSRVNSAISSQGRGRRGGHSR
jgi:hypothetical protein